MKLFEVNLIKSRRVLDKRGLMINTKMFWFHPPAIRFGSKAWNQKKIMERYNQSYIVASALFQKMGG
jgi:hypothetical protein